ncbi:hypothetical protein GCM10009863_66450 [Streptomyces axinellae]|uniref:Uncharacterized protein n=1 Tax=Streptomyces axinellae TaxID=552788 RepID=A0ABN3R0K6_9ACTN
MEFVDTDSYAGGCGTAEHPQGVSSEDAQTDCGRQQITRKLNGHGPGNPLRRAGEDPSSARVFEGACRILCPVRRAPERWRATGNPKKIRNVPVRSPRLV